MRPENWFQNRLQKYIADKYSIYNETIEFYPDPSPRQWLFKIPELDVRIEITCHDDGRVTELRYII